MSITSHQGPLFVPGAGPAIGGVTIDTNDSAGPSCFAHGVGIVDTRFGPFGGADITAVRPVWWGSDFICVLDQVPAALSTTNIVAAAVPVAGTPMTLAGASTGITVLATPLSIIAGQVFPAGALMIDGNPALITLAAVGGGVSMYDPRTMSARTLLFTSAGNDSSATATVVGQDMYGYTIHDTVTLTNASTVATTKAFKSVQSVTPAGTLSGSNLSVGVNDTYEFGLAAWEFQFVQIYWNSTLISASTGYTAPVTTTPSATTGDVRGTYTVQSSSDGTKKLQMFVRPQPWNLVATGANSLFGQVQF
jgi:hypothetical protein